MSVELRGSRSENEVESGILWDEKARAGFGENSLQIVLVYDDCFRLDSLRVDGGIFDTKTGMGADIGVRKGAVKRVEIGKNTDYAGS